MAVLYPKQPTISDISDPFLPGASAFCSMSNHNGKLRTNHSKFQKDLLWHGCVMTFNGLYNKLLFQD